MFNIGELKGRTLFVTGGSRGIGKAIALKAAKDGANIVIAAKTAKPHPKLPGTIYTTAKEIEEAGGKCLPCIVDVREESQIIDAVNKAIETFGGIDIVINNASAISLTGTLETTTKSKTCLPYLKKSKCAHILNISPPLNLNSNWFKEHLVYTMSKYAVSMCTLGMAAEFKKYNIAVNALWPRTVIHTTAVEMLCGVNEAKLFSRKTDIIADAAYAIITKSSDYYTGQFLIDDEVLQQEGIIDFDQYLSDPTKKGNLIMDFFMEENTHDGFNRGKETAKKQLYDQLRN